MSNYVTSATVSLLLATSSGCYYGCVDPSECLDPRYPPIGPVVTSVDECVTVDTSGPFVELLTCTLACESATCSGIDGALYCEPCERVETWMQRKCTGDCLDSGSFDFVKIECNLSH